MIRVFDKTDLGRYCPDIVQPRITDFWRLLFNDPGYVAVALLRLQQKQLVLGRRRAATLIRQLNLTCRGCDFVLGAQVGPGLLIRHPQGIVVGGGVVLGAGCTLLQGVTLGDSSLSRGASRGDPTIGAAVIIGVNASVLGPIHIGDGSTIGAGSVVLKSVEAGATVVGVPARQLSDLQK